MKSLEDFWDSYPDSEPPTGELLREARRRARARRRRLVVRPLLAGGTVAALVAAFVVGNQTAEGPPTTPDTAVAPPLQFSAFRASLHPASSCDQLLESYRSRGAAQVGPYGWYGGAIPLDGTFYRAQGLAADLATAPHAVAGRVPTVGNSATGTNVQEVGVDEPDDVKTDGSMIVRVHGSVLSVYDASGATIRRTARMTLPRLRDAELLLSGDTVVAIGSDTGRAFTRHDVQVPRTRVETISVADPAKPIVTSSVAYSGNVTSARQHGSVARLVLSSGPPNLAFVQPHRGLSTKQARNRNRDIVRHSTLRDWLPSYDDGSGSRPLLDCENVAIPPTGLPLGTVGIVGFDASAPAAFDAIGIAGQTGTAYESADHLYLTASRSAGVCACPMMLHADRAIAPGAIPCCGSTSGPTTIFQFDLEGTRAIHVATGTVDGSIADRWSMDEAGDVLRVATTSQEKGRRRFVQSSSVVTMRADGDRLVEIGRLNGLGVNETLTAARWFDDLAIVSTARHIDPLFSVDLTDPAHPRLLGALHIPGYTTYFHPIGNGLLIGVGQKVAFDSGREHERAQVALFDISDLTDARQIDVAPLQQWTWPIAADDPRAFTWLPDRATALTTFRTRSNATVLGSYHVSGTTLTQRLRPLSVRDGATVRTFELADGRVVLMAGGHLQFLDL